MPLSLRLMLHRLWLAIAYPFALLWLGFDWAFLRDIRQNRIVASMSFWLAFVPIAAKLLHEVADVVTVTVGGQVFTIHTTLPFSWQTLFFAAVLFSAGNALVSILCPKIVLEHKDFASFETSGKTEVHIREYERKFGSLSEEDRARLQHLAGIESKFPDDQDLRSRFWKTHAIQTKNNHLYRWICSALYAVGFVLLSDILIKQIGWVVNSLDLSGYLHQLILWPVLEWLARWA